MMHSSILPALLEQFYSIKSLARIEQALLSIAKLWTEKQIDDDDYSFLSKFLHTRQKSVREIDRVAVRAPDVVSKGRDAGFQSFFPPKKKIPKSSDPEASRERRGQLASSNPLPSNLHRKFTEAQRAVLKILADEVKRKGGCRLYLAEIAARAGCGLTTARDTIRKAAYLGLVTIAERRQRQRPNLSNIIKIISHEWKEWISSRRFFVFLNFAGASLAAGSRGGASKKVGPTDKGILDSGGMAASLPYS